MSEVIRSAWAIARSGWRSSYNRTFRFSRMKTAVITLALQAVFFWFIVRRAPAMASGASREGLGGLLALMAVQMGWFGMMYGFARGQMQLYQGILVPLFQITPARPLAFLLGRVIEAVPARAWSCLLWAFAYSSAVVGPARWGAMLGLALFGLAVGMAAHLSGLLLLSFWSRYSPKTMRHGTVFFGVVTLALVTWAIIFVAQGGTVTELALLMREYRVVTYATVLGLTGVPGLLLLGGLAVRPAAVEDLYRQGVYQVLEVADTEVVRSQRSIWLPFRNHVVRAVLSREWLELYRSKVARIQLLIWAAGAVGIYFTGDAMLGAPLPRLIAYVGGLSLFAWFMAYGHWVVRVFEKERRTMLLYRLATVPSGRLIFAKFISLFVPSALLVAGGVLIGCWSAAATAGETLQVLAWTLGALAAGTAGGFGMSAATAGESEDNESSNAPKRDENAGGAQSGNNAWWALARTAALAITTIFPVWMAAGQPGLPWNLPTLLLTTVAALLPLGMLTAGTWLMRRFWEANA